MWNKPSADRLALIPCLYETEKIPLNDKLIYLHFYILGCDWYVCEYDGKDRFFGFAILNDDLQNAEWGYYSFSELKYLSAGPYQVDCETEMAWQIRPAAEVEKISIAMCWGPKPNIK